MSDGKVARNTAYLLTASIGQKLLALAYFMVIARLADVDGTGKYLIATAFASMFSVIMDLGLSNVVVREVAKEGDDAQSFLSGVVGAKLTLAAVFTVVVHAAAWLMGYGTEMRLMILVASAAMVLESLQVTFYSVIRGFQNLRHEAVGVIVGQVVVLTAGTGLFFLTRSPIALVAAVLLNTAWNVIWGGFILTHRYGLSLRPHWDLDQLRGLAMIAAPFALAAVFSRVFSYVDQVLMSRLATPAEAGLYGAAYKLTFAFSFLPSSLSAALYPAMSSYWHKDRQHLAEVYGNSLKYMLMVAAPLAVGLCVLAEPTMPFVFGKPFSAGAAPLRILVFSLIFSFMYWPTGALLNACDRQARNTLVMGLAMTTSIVTNLLLLARLGAEGAAAANLLSNVVLFAAAFWPAAKVVHLPLGRFFGGMARVLLAAAVMGAVVAAAWPRLGFIPAIIAGAVSYPIALLGCGGVSKAEAVGLLKLFLRRRRRPLDVPTV